MTDPLAFPPWCEPPWCECAICERVRRRGASDQEADRQTAQGRDTGPDASDDRPPWRPHDTH